jgi:ABC-2 type transport system ATP-binding protein
MIKIEDLTKYYNATCALDHINVEIKKGEIVGLLGPNGAGKTTTLRILTCYMPPTSGGIQVKDYNIRQNALEIKKLIGYLPESAPVYKHMIVYDYLTYVADIREIPANARDKRLHDLADLCGLNDVMHKNVYELSKGYRQRVGLAHAMMSDPEILVLDEPTSGLDPNQIIEVREIIKRIGKEKTIILSTHILSEVEAACNRVIIINKGKIVADDETKNLQKTAGEQYAIRLVLRNAAFRDVEAKLSHVQGVSKVKNNGEQDGLVTCELLCATKDDIRGSIYSEIKKQDWMLLEFAQEKSSLEAIFRKLTLEDLS